MEIALLIRVNCRREASCRLLAGDQTKLEKGFAGNAVKSGTDTLGRSILDGNADNVANAKNCLLGFEIWGYGLGTHCPRSEIKYQQKNGK